MAVTIEIPATVEKRVKKAEPWTPPEDTWLDSRERAANQHRHLGIRPYFYKDEDVKLTKDVIASVSATENIIGNLDTLYTVFPAVDVPPANFPIMPGDTFGFYRLGMTHFLLRPDMANTRSCHGTCAEYPMANFAYLANPMWACYGFYQHDREVAINPRTASFRDKCAKLGVTHRNLVATINVMFGYNHVGKASVMLSRAYGSTPYYGKHMYTRLINYFKYVLRLNVYESLAYVKCQHVDNHLPEGTPFIPTGTLYSPMSELGVQAAYYFTDWEAKEKTSQVRPIFRYADVNDPHYFGNGDGRVFSIEEHGVKFLAKRDGVLPNIGMDIGSSSYRAIPKLVKKVSKNLITSTNHVRVRH